jgi:hypothetical protein
MKYSISEILERASAGDKVNGKAALLVKYDNPTLRKILKYTFSEKVTFNGLPEGEPPYRPNTLVDVENVLYAETRRLYLFTDGGNPNLSQVRKEAIYIEMLENVDSRDAKLLVSMKDKKLPEEFKGITKAVVKKAFPDLL